MTESLSRWLVDAYALSTLVLLASAAATAAIRQPARRLAVAGATLGGLVALLAALALPGWPRSSLRARPVTPDPRPAMNFAPIATSPPPVVAPPADLALPIAPSPAPPTIPVPPPAAPPDLGAIAVRAFLGGSTLALGWLALGAWRLALLRRGSRRAPARAEEVLARLAGDSTPPALLVSDALRQPAAVGVARPAILLPSRFLGEPADRLEAALAHEWAHVRDGDLRRLALSRLLLPALFAHPLYWLLRARIRADQEAVADASAAAVAGRLGYAEALLAWSKSAPESPWIAAGGSVALFERPSQIKRRIAMLLDTEIQVESACPARWRLASRGVVAAVALAASLLTLRPPAVAAPSEEPAEVAAPGDADGPLLRVLGPDGEPFAGAKVRVGEPGRGGADAALVGETGPDGAIRLPKAARGGRASVIATAEGFAPAFPVDLTAPDGTMVLRLARDDVPIRGRLVDREGRPVAGARVVATTIQGHSSGTLEGVLQAFGRPGGPAGSFTFRENVPGPYAVAPTVSDADGRFVVRGVGRDRTASLAVSGPGVAITSIHVAAREMPALELRPPSFWEERRDTLLHGATFEVALDPGAEVVGTVTDEATGLPVAGATVARGFARDDPWGLYSTTTDAEGRYRLEGLSPGPRRREAGANDLTAARVAAPPYAAVSHRVAIADPSRPTVQDFKLRRAIRGHGRVIDKATGRGVRASVTYNGFEHASASSLSFIRHADGVVEEIEGPPNAVLWPVGSGVETDDQGYFEIFMVPGPAVLAARVPGGRYRMGAGFETIPWPKRDGKVVTSDDDVSSALRPYDHHVVQGVDPKPGDEEFACDLVLDPGRSVAARVVGPDGEPLAGAWVGGDEMYVTESSPTFTPRTGPLPTADFRVERLIPHAPRVVEGTHVEKKLAGGVVVGPDEAGPVTLKLEPWGAVTGRVVDVAGRPVAAWPLQCPIPYRNPRHDLGGIHRPIAPTDAEGRFRIEGLAPGRKYTFISWVRQPDGNGGREVVVAKDVVVKAGESRDLGDVVLKDPR
ncbi:MAG: hypothetical protein BGO49_18330 [Planctomycetales bacterium 71-10]|nr:MAG: hypothetical protein BGO49_18330 [Planctomycetales bacterium 71-10]